jgi:anti-sigma B factor antagonist
MRPSGAGDRLAKYDHADWDYTLSTMLWTSWSLVVKATSTDYGSSSIWGKRSLLPDGEDTVQISTRRHDKVTIFDLSGDIDFANSPELRQSVLREIRENCPPRVVINLSKVHYIDSSGVASLVEGLKASRDLGSRFILFGLSTSAREMLQLSRLIKVFEVYENEEQALVV